jgi:phosphatidylinositol dimannoside acyltransferase
MGGMLGIRQRTTYVAYRSLAEALRRLPEPAANVGALTVGQALYYLNGPARRMSHQHMERVLRSEVIEGSAPPDHELVRRLSQRSFRTYARYWLEGARLPHTDLSTVADRMIIERGFEHVVSGMAAGKGLVMALPHVGSWEWGGAFLAFSGYPMTSVAEPIQPPELMEWFVEQRHGMGLHIVPYDQAGPALLRVLRQGGLVGLICDRDLTGDGVEVEFFGETTTMPGGAATLALRTGATLVVGVVYSGPGKMHTGVVSDPIPAVRQGRLRDDVTRVTQAIARDLEGFIHRAPEQWHLFQPNWPSDRRAINGSSAASGRVVEWLRRREPSR